MSSLWALGRVLGRGGQSSFVGGCGGPFSSMAGLRGLWVIVCGWCAWFARGRRHRLGPFMAGGRPGAVVVGRPGLLAMVW